VDRIHIRDTRHALAMHQVNDRQHPGWSVVALLPTPPPAGRQTRERATSAKASLRNPLPDGSRALNQAPDGGFVTSQVRAP